MSTMATRPYSAAIPSSGRMVRARLLGESLDLLADDRLPTDSAVPSKRSTDTLSAVAELHSLRSVLQQNASCATKTRLAVPNNDDTTRRIKIFDPVRHRWLAGLAIVYTLSSL